MSADLTDANGKIVAHGIATQEVSVGANIINLKFNGADIYASQTDGPYQLTNMLLTDVQGVALVVAEAQNVYTTATYYWRDFADFIDDVPDHVESVTQTSPNNIDLRYFVNFSGDEDWFRFHVGADSNLQVHLTSLPANYDVYLYTANGSLLGSSTKDNKAAEEIFLANALIGDYYVRVVGVNGTWDATNPYQLRFNVVGQGR